MKWLLREGNYVPMSDVQQNFVHVVLPVYISYNIAELKGVLGIYGIEETDILSPDYWPGTTDYSL